MAAPASLLTVHLERAPVAIIGVGNVLMHDDAFGPTLVRRLESHAALASRGEALEFVDVGTAGFDLLHHLLGRERVILLDAIAPRDGEPPGTVRIIEHDELMAMARHGVAGTPHEPSILAALQVASLAGALPRVTLIGMVPADVGAGVGLSPAVEAAITAAMTAAMTAAGTACDRVMGHGS